MQDACLLPITFNEFLDWYNRQRMDFAGFRFVPVELDEADGRITIDPAWRKRLAESVPSYDDDFQVLIALVRTGGRPTLYNRIPMEAESSRKEAAAYYEASITDLAGLYPISERGGRLLETRLSADVRLGPPLFEDAIRSVERERTRGLAVRGARALLELYDLTTFEGKIEGREPEIWSAVRAKVETDRSVASREDGKAQARRSFAYDLMTYDRHDKPEFPSTQLGYVYDYFLIAYQRLQRLLSPEKVEQAAREHLHPARQTLDELKANQTPLGMALRDGMLDTHFEQLRGLPALETDKYPPLACIFFLNIREDLRQHEDLGQTDIDGWSDTLRMKGREPALALGLWMVGAFFDFSHFAEEYYARSSFAQAPPDMLAAAPPSMA